MRFIFLLLSFFFCFLPIYAQVNDWVKALNDNTLSIDEKLDVGELLIDYYHKKDKDSTMYYAQYYLRFSKKHQLSDAEDYAHSVIASLYRYTGYYDSAIYYYEQALIGYEKSDFMDGVAATYQNMANVYTNQNRYDLAIRNYFKAIDLFIANNQRDYLYNLYSSLAGLYLYLGNLEKADYYWTLSEESTLGTEQEGNYSFPYRGKARINTQKGKLKTARELANKALEIDLISNNRVHLYDDYLILYQIQSKSSNLTEFLNGKRKVEEFRDIKNPINLQLFYEFTGDFYFETKEYTNALIYYDSCITSLRIEQAHQPDSYVEELHRLLTKKYHTLVFSKSSEDLTDLYAEIQMLSIQSDEIRKIRTTQELDAQYYLKEVEEKNEALRVKNIFYQELTKKNKIQIALLIITLILIIGFAFYMLYSNKKIKAFQKILEQNVQEKDFLFRELNHRVKNNLFIVNSFIGIEKHGKSEELSQVLTTVENRIHSLSLMHELLYQGQVEEETNLNEYIDKLIISLSRSILKDQMKIQTSIGENIRININKISYLGLIINELITNASKHAKIDDKELIITVTIYQKEDTLMLEFSDDGKGFSDEVSKLNSSLALKIARGLTQQLKGKFTIKDVEKGASFEISIPN